MSSMEDDTDMKDLKDDTCFERVFILLWWAFRGGEGEAKNGFGTRECVGHEVPKLGVERNSKVDEAS